MGDRVQTVRQVRTQSADVGQVPGNVGEPAIASQADRAAGGSLPKARPRAVAPGGVGATARSHD
jgi:hypothetical protein